MVSDFDPIKAQREIIMGLTDIHKVFVTRARTAEQKLAEAEADLNACRQMESFARKMLEDATAKLRALQDEAAA